MSVRMKKSGYCQHFLGRTGWLDLHQKKNHERINKSGIGVKKIEQKVDKHKLIACYSDLGNGVGSKHRTLEQNIIILS